MVKSLNENWKVTHIPYNQTVSDILDETFVPEGWLDADIPEEIHSTLRKAGIIRGNVYSKNADEENWIEQVDWVYYKEFYMPSSFRGKRVTIEFKGLDTFCDIYLNGVKVGFSQNMHVPVSVDIANELKYGYRNVLVVRFYSAVKYVESMDQRKLFSTTTSDRILARKAQMNYSWDFCGRCVTTGIWKDVSIHACDDVQIDSYYLYTKNIKKDYAVLGLEVEPDIEENCENYSVSVCIRKDSKRVFVRKGSFEDFKSLDIKIENPALWWPRPYGKPELYDVDLILERNDKIVQEKHEKFGIRKVEIIQENQEDGRSFIFSVNDRRLFIRGANWVPTNTVYTDITDKDYEVLINYAVKGNISMLRIWGGGIYENDKMFELCDEKGIMVWNDFMFACGIYPQNREFLGNVTSEAEYILKKYRNYTSLVIWAGDNENGQAYGWAGRPYEFGDDKISNVVLKNACRQFDPHRPYIPTSPCSPDEFYKGGDNPESPYQGDVHLYIMSSDPGVCANRDYGKNYYKRVKGYKPRFVSEFGFISLPEKDTFYKYNFKKEPIRYTEEFMEFIPFIREYLEKEEHDKVIYYSQVYNAMALKYWIEYFRILKWTCAGSLYWKFNDPVADCSKGYVFPSHMSTVDMYKQPKMTYYYTRRAYDDLIVACEETDEGYNVFSCSEILEDVKGELVISHRDFSGSIVAEQKIECTAPGDRSTFLYNISSKDLKVNNASNEYLKIEFATANKVLENRYFFVDICEINKLELADSGLKVIDVKRNGMKIHLRLKTERYARNVRVNILDKWADYSDNYFEIDAGTERDIVITLHDIEGIENTVLYIEGENVRRHTVSLAAI